MANMIWKVSVCLLCTVVTVCSVSLSAKRPDTTLRFQQSVFPSQQKESTSQCQYEACNAGKPDMLNVHMVAHTHDDVGWLKTVDQYYTGARPEITDVAVQYILDTVIQELRADPKRKFIYVEVAFFYRWWREQHDYMRHIVKGLVNKGQLQFILGGWCMNDEASTHYNAIIDQHTIGFRFLEDTFGECGRPVIGWQIDPFGHSREQASLFAQFGFDGYFFGRLDYQDKDKRMSEKTPEMMWEASADLGEQGFIFTGVNYNGYSPPTGFCFDSHCNDGPIVDDHKLEDYNADVKVKQFLKIVNEQARNYSTNHIMLTMGSDFQFTNAHQNYKNLDKLIQLVNEQERNGVKVNAFYSTPQCYLLALNKANKTWTTKQDDFFPYAHRPYSFWTGYFTSRAALKDYVRKTNNFLQVCKQLDALADLEAKFGSDLKIRDLEQAMGVAQHHDAVSGTSKQAVADDYALRLYKGTVRCQEVIYDSYNKLLSKGSDALPEQHFCPLVNISSCSFTETNTKFTVIAYNPIGRKLVAPIRVPVTAGKFRVLNSQGQTLPSQMISVTDRTKSIPERSNSKANAELYFEALLPALGFSTFFVESTSDTPSEKLAEEEKITERFSMENEHLAVHFDGESGLLSGITMKKENKEVSVGQNFYYYEGHPGNNSKPEFQASGAYIFRPVGGAKKVSTKVISTNVTGELVQEVRQKFNDWTTQVIRLYRNSRFVEFEWTVGPIPIADKIGKEIVSRFNSNLQNADLFYTDSNGREILERKNNYRPTWKLVQTEMIAGNYFPVNSRIYIKDKALDTQLTILTDRSQGGASPIHGSIELMVHRRLLYDDSLGVGEPLNETGSDGKGLVIRGKHYLLLENLAEANSSHRDFAEKLFMQPVTSFSANELTPAEYNKKFATSWSGLKTGTLPDNVHLLTLQGWRAKTILVRLEHFYEKNEDPKLSQPVTVQLKDLFVGLEMVSVQELTLGANKKLEDAKRLMWKVENHGTTKADMSSFVTPLDSSKWGVLLNPMQIRTFQVEIKM
uniref:Alpha-mannosidase n=1 Tax=Platynereis dumerilii TaxID=6359 RepID=A0A6B9MQY7_PLADU|nr:lysosomal alpha-mannosidase [Platynereis dumerilii]